MNVRVPVPDVAQIALEVAVVNGIEAHYGNIKPDVCFGELVANDVVISVQDGFDFVKRLEYELNRRLVCGLSGGEARFVDAI